MKKVGPVVGWLAQVHTAGRGAFPSELRPFGSKVSELSYHSPSEVIEPKDDVKTQAVQPSNFPGKKTETERYERTSSYHSELTAEPETKLDLISPTWKLSSVFLVEKQST